MLRLPADVSTAMRLLSYTGATHLLLVPTNLPQGVKSSDIGSKADRMMHFCNASVAAMHAALRRHTMSHNGTARTVVLPSSLSSVKVSCLHPSAGSPSTVRRQPSESVPWSPTLYMLSAALLLSETHYMLANMDNEFAKIVHLLMLSKQTGAASSKEVPLPLAYDLLSSTTGHVPSLWVPTPIGKSNGTPKAPSAGKGSGGGKSSGGGLSGGGKASKSGKTTGAAIQSLAMQESLGESK